MYVHACLYEKLSDAEERVHAATANLRKEKQRLILICI